MLKNEDGAVSVLFALSMAFLLGFAALSVDVAMVHLKKAEMQNAADAGALAGAQDLPNAGNAISKAKNFAELNGAKRSNITVTTPYNGDDTKIQVVVTAEDVPHFFASVWGNTETDVPARAVAEKISGEEEGGYALFAEGDDAELTLNGEDITVDGSIYTGGDFEADGEDISVSGDVDAVGIMKQIDDDDLIPNQNEGVDPIEMETFTTEIGLDDGSRDKNNPNDLVDQVLYEEPIKNYKCGDVEINCNTTKNLHIKKGKAEIKTAGLTINHSIIARDEIIINEPNVTFGTPENPVLLYSKKKKIVFNADNITIYGTIYAEKDWVEINPSDPFVLHGRVVAKHVKINGPTVTVDASSLSGGGGNDTIHLIE